MSYMSCHCYAQCTQTADVIFNKIKARIIKDSHSDFLIRAKPRSNLTSMMRPALGRRSLLTFIVLLIIKILLTIASVKATKINEKLCIFEDSFRDQKGNINLMTTKHAGPTQLIQCISNLIKPAICINCCGYKSC